jgi:arabinose-5-phosphate isomerase
MSKAAVSSRAPAEPATTAATYSQFEQLREGRAIIKQEAETLLELSQRLDTDFCRVVDLLLHLRGRVVITGVGKAGLIGQKVVATLASTGTRSQFLHPTEALHGDLGCLSSDDVLLAISNSGETQEVCDVVAAARSLDVTCVALTGNEFSTLGLQAEIVLRLGSIREAGPLSLAPTCSTTAMLAVGDALALVLSRARGFTPQQFAVLHPGGSLGRRLRTVREVMRSGQQLRIAAQSATIREVFSSPSCGGRRTGAVILIDDDGCLSGLFTDSDLARLLEQHREGQLDRPIGEAMTKSPLTIDADSLLHDAVEVLSSRKISELPVVDDSHRPIGLIDITDVIGMMPADDEGIKN